MLLLYTGEGKGKTTAALGLAMRAVGWGKKVVIIQFIKSADRVYGEKSSLEKLGVEIIQTGVGFTWLKTPDEHRTALLNGWKIAKEKLQSLEYDLVIIDELNNALAIDRFPINDVLPLAEVAEVIKVAKSKMTIVVTGRSANQELIELADLVTEMKPIKHYYENGISAVEGIEY